MTALTTPTRGENHLNGNGAKPPAPTKARRSPPAFVVGLLVAAVALGVFVLLSPKALRTTPVLVLGRAVPAGVAIQASDLRVDSLALPRSVASVPAARESSVVGESATSDLEAGSLLTPSSYGSQAAEATVGLQLKPGQYPPGLAPGDQAELIVGPPPQGGAGLYGATVGTVLAPTARVTAATATASDPDVVLVSVQVPPAEALTTAEVASAGQVVVVENQ